MRYSKQREKIYQAVAGTKTHPDAEWIYERVRLDMPSISLGTVYRNLGGLCNAGKIVTLETDLGSVRYDADTSGHQHFVCRKCGRITDVGQSSMRERLTDAGYIVCSEKHIFYGICHECNTNSEE